MAMLDRTAVSGQTVDEFKASFGDRLVALARVRGLLSRAAPGDSVTFDRLLESELSSQSEDGGTVSLDGPPAIVLRSNSLQALAMALHELTTNATKYGALGHNAVKYEALGQKSGRLHVRWRVQAENGSPWIIVDWKESGAETAQSSGGSRGAGNGPVFYRVGGELMQRHRQCLHRVGSKHDRRRSVEGHGSAIL